MLKLRKEVLGGRQLSLEEIKDCCRHEAKQRHGWLVASSYDNPVPAAIGNAVQTMSNAVQGSSEWQAAKDEYGRLNAQLKQSIPADRHSNRMSALYVDPISLAEWNGPAKKITRKFAFAFLMDVGNEYALEAGHGYSDLEIVATRDAELAEALKNWVDRPTMPARELVLP